ncbi:PXA domain-containing protein [Mycena floridula]|nr:PXA domain-containing protein [Mycena floridula]
MASFSSHLSQQQPVPLSKRLLFPQLPTNELPPLLATPSTPPELTAELYDFIALALRAFVNPWWTKISRYDKEFLPEITRILTVVVRSLEDRILNTDLAPLVYHDIPVILVQHYRDYRNAAAKVGTSYASGGSLSLPHLFHHLQPHIALSPDGKLDPEYFRQVIDHILKECLPPEHYAPESERFIVREVILKVVLNDILPKITQPWFINKLILDNLDQSQRELKSVKVASPPSSSPFSFHTLLVMLLSAIQSISGGCLAMVTAYKQAMNTIKRVNMTPRRVSSPRPPQPQPQDSPPAAPAYQPRPAMDPLSVSPVPSMHSSISSIPKSPINSVAPKQPVVEQDDYAYFPLVMAGEIFTTSERFAATAVMNVLFMLSSCFTLFLDRLLPFLLMNFLSTAFLLKTTRTAKRTMFPNGYPAPPPVDPTPEEQAEIRANLIAWRGQGASAHFIPFFLGPDPSVALGAALDPLSSVPCNMHLAVMILDRVLVCLFPGLVQNRVS